MRHRLRTSRRPSTRSAAVARCLVRLSALVVGPHAAIAHKQAGGPAPSPEPTPAPKSAGTTGLTLTVLERRWQVDDLVGSDVPTVEEGLVALRDVNHDLHAFDAGSGEPLWQAASDAGEPLSFIPVARGSGPRTGHLPPDGLPGPLPVPADLVP
jgi:hypothetical protein